MNIEEHKKRHQELHRELDELLADYISRDSSHHVTDKIIELLEWSFKQTQNPTEAI